MVVLLLVAVLQLTVTAFAEDQGRIKRPPPTPIEAERIASDLAMNDSILHKGDIISTGRGFFLFRGLGPDGVTNEFVSVPNPLSARQGRKN
jgi:hypothetical protein